MKKILAIMATVLLLASCSGDDDNKTPDDSFYALKEGNYWVYKRCYTYPDGTVMPDSDVQIDTVRVIGKEDIHGLAYYKLEHSKTRRTKYDYRRVNEKGYLINERDVVIHPGTDANFIDTYNIMGGSEIVGTATCQLVPKRDIVLEGKTYSGYSYVGYLVSVGEKGLYEGLGLDVSCQKGIGIVLNKTRWVVQPNFIEERLISYKVN
jgi:hypothetical protein